MIPFHRLAAGAAVVSLLLSALCGCEIFKKDAEVQAVVGQRVVGMQVGAFIDRYGSYYHRSDLEDGSTVYIWISQVGPTPSGQMGQDDRTCTIHFTADRNGRIVSVDVDTDNPGRVSLSRCGEIFKATP